MIHIPSFRLGPYQTYRQFTFEIETCKERVNWKNVGRGLFRISIGIIKHLIVFHWIQRRFFYSEGYFGPFSTGFFEDAATMSPTQLWLMAYLWAMRFYLFMSGFSDGVIGMNLMMGIRVPENFRYPFLATNMIEFWRRWHCSVATWLRDEIFIPLGAERRRSLNYFLTFAYCGFWHWPFLWPTMVLFPILQVVVFSLTHAWQMFWSRKRAGGDRMYEIARRWQLVDSVPSRIAGACLAVTVFMVSCLLLFDHNFSGLPMMARMMGW